MFENTTDLNCSSKKEKYTPAAINEIINLRYLYCLLNVSMTGLKTKLVLKVIFKIVVTSGACLDIGDCILFI